MYSDIHSDSIVYEKDGRYSIHVARRNESRCTMRTGNYTERTSLPIDRRQKAEEVNRMNDPRVSVIIPIYNAEAFLERCLESLVHQTCSCFEVICIDDQSTDSSLSIARNFEQAHPERFRVFRNEHNVGQGRTRERGINLVDSRYIMFVDSDDYVAGDYVETYLNAAEKDDLDIVIAGHTRDVDGILRVVPAPHEDWSITTYAVSWAKLFRTSFLVEHNIHFARERRGEDIFFNVACFCCKPRFAVLDYSGYHYRLNRTSTTNSISSTDCFERDISAMFHELLDEWLHFDLTPNQRTVIAYTYFANMINALLVYGHGCGPEMMREKYRFVFDDAERLFPGFLSCPFFQWGWARGQAIKIRASFWLLMNLHRFKLDKAIFWLFSLR